MQDSNREGLGISGRFTITLRDAKSGEITDEVKVTNLVVTAGRNTVADQLKGTGTASLNACAVGSGTTAVALTDTAMQTAIGSNKNATTRTRANQTATISFFYDTGDNNGAWKEVGLFYNDGTPTMFAHAKIDPTITKSTSVTATVDWEITVG